jgi:hypothetical protein
MRAWFVARTLKGHEDESLLSADSDSEMWLEDESQHYPKNKIN